jgi:predicted Zn-dependent peptidase
MLVLLALALAAPAALGQEVERTTLANGLRVVTRYDPGTDIVAVDLLLDISARDEPAGRSGSRCLVQRLLLRGTVSETGDSMGSRLAAAGGVADTSLGLDYVEIYALVPSDGFELALGMVAEMVRHPAFLAEEVERQRQAAVETARAGQEDGFQETYLALRQALYGGDAYARSVFGDPSSLASMTREELVAFHQRYYQPGRAVLAVCGGIASARVTRAVRGAFGDWTGNTAGPRPPQPAVPLSSSQVVARELPVRRAHLMLAFPAPAAGEPGYYEMQIIDSLLGGRSSARLPRLLRDELGLAYEVSTFYPTLAGPSHLAVYVVTDPSQIELVKTKLRDALVTIACEPVSPEELAKAKRYLLGSYALSHQRMKDQAYSLAWYEVLGLGAGFGERYAAAVQAVTAAGVQAAAQQALRHFVLAVAMPTE